MSCWVSTTHGVFPHILTAPYSYLWQMEPRHCPSSQLPWAPQSAGQTTSPPGRFAVFSGQIIFFGIRKSHPNKHQRKFGKLWQKQQRSAQLQIFSALEDRFAKPYLTLNMECCELSFGKSEATGPGRQKHFLRFGQVWKAKSRSFGKKCGTGAGHESWHSAEQPLLTNAIATTLFACGSALRPDKANTSVKKRNFLGI